MLRFSDNVHVLVHISDTAKRLAFIRNSNKSEIATTLFDSVQYFIFISDHEIGRQIIFEQTNALMLKSAKTYPISRVFPYMPYQQNH